MSTRCMDIDPCGDTLVILQKADTPHDQPTFAEAGSSDRLGAQSGLHLLCSKKHLTSASDRARRMFAGGFSEAIPEETDGLFHWKFEPIFDPNAFEIVMKIIHGRTRDIPRTVTSELLAGIAAVVDDLECHDALWFFAKGWLIDHKFNAPAWMCKELVQFVLISFVFEDLSLFEASTRTAITCSLGSMPTFGLPIRPKIIERVEKERRKVLDKLISGLYDLERQLLCQELGCSPGCRSMLLGALIQAMKENALHSPRPSKPFHSLSVKRTLESLRKYQSPRYYSSEQDSPLGKHSGVWRIESYPRNSKSKGGNSQGFWGNQMTLDEAPRSLVRHHCCLDDIIDPLLQATETQVKGLRLAEFSRS